MDCWKIPGFFTNFADVPSMARPRHSMASDGDFHMGFSPDVCSQPMDGPAHLDPIKIQDESRTQYKSYGWTSQDHFRLDTGI